ncbi:MAG: FAD-dependent oxidoreductase [Solobacterium sp.]|nr:FAD-dependent oxidoreductase [Solobacterium sp.]
MADYSIFSEPLKIGAVTVPNRFSVGPMGTGAFMDENGGFSDNGIAYFTERAKGGFGMVVTGAIGCEDVIDPFQASPVPTSHREHFLETSRKLNDSIHANNAKMFIQLTMGLGRNYPYLPSCSPNIVYGTTDQLSPELTKEQIHIKINGVIANAKLAKEAGFDGVEVHAMHWGYLLDQFGTELFNRRTDEYGGTRENRLRAAREIVEGIKKECGEDFPVGMRMSMKSFIKDINQATLTGEGEKGRTLEESVECCKLLESYGYDYLSVDVGTYDSFYFAEPPVYMPLGFMNDMAAAAKKAVNIPILAGGRMQDPDLSAQGIRDGKFDGVVLARQSLADPYYPKKLYEGRPEDIRRCIGCSLGCFNRALTGQGPASCALNPAAGVELLNGLKPADSKKKVVVIGGGAAGMEAAMISAQRGHEVTLFEKSDHLGGHLVEAGGHSFKKEIGLLNKWFAKQLKDLNVNVKLNSEPCVNCVKAENPDIILLATGSVPSAPPIPGLEKAIVSLDAINHPEQLGKEVIIVGGGLVGCELALDEAKNGKKVTVVEALNDILSSGPSVPGPNKQMIGDMFAYYGVTVCTNTKLTEVRDGCAVVEHDGVITELKADSIVSALGFRPGKSLKEEFETLGVPVKVLGDAEEAKTIMNAVWTAYDAANAI